MEKLGFNLWNLNTNTHAIEHDLTVPNIDIKERDTKSSYIPKENFTAKTKLIKKEKLYIENKLTMKIIPNL